MGCLAFVNRSDADDEENDSEDNCDGRKHHHKAGANDYFNQFSSSRPVFGGNIHFYCQRGLVSGLAASELRDLTYKDTSDEGYECHHGRRLTDESTVSSPDDN